jgi:hypothetical protein
MRVRPMVGATARCDSQSMNSSRHNSLVSDHPDHLFYVESSVAPGLTLSEYRRRRRRPTRWGRLKELAGGAQGAAQPA